MNKTDLTIATYVVLQSKKVREKNTQARTNNSRLSQEMKELLFMNEALIDDLVGLVDSYRREMIALNNQGLLSE